MYSESKVLYFKELYLNDFEAGDIIIFPSRNVIIITKKEYRLIEWIKIERYPNIGNLYRNGREENSSEIFVHCVFLIKANPRCKGDVLI